MIAADATVFPGNVSIALKACLDLIDAEVKVFLRPLLATDGIQAIGCYETEAVPNIESLEMRGYVMGAQQPVLTTYDFNVMSMVVHSDQMIGIAQHSTLAKRVRSTVANNPDLDVALKALASTEFGRVERAQRWGFRRQSFQTGDLNGMFLFVSVSEFWLETETR